MLDHAAEKLRLLITDVISDNECNAINSDKMTPKAIMLIKNSEFARSVINKLTTLPMSYLCRIESVTELDGIIAVASDDWGEPVSEPSPHDIYAACCAALVLKECGAAHSRLCESIRRNGDRTRVFGLDGIIPFTADSEAAEISAIEAVCGVKGSSLESLREKLAIHINQLEAASRRKAEAEKLKAMLLAEKSFRDEWTSLEYMNAGSYGFIFRAVSAADGRAYALKVINVGSDMEKLWKAKRESTNASQFYMSDYIVKVYDDGKLILGSEKYVWISMELLEPIPCEISDEKTVARIACDICCALDDIHKNGGMAHRDIKPGNILYGDGHWKLCDFGITKEVQGRDLATVIGTSDYMAPELLRAAAASTDRTSYDNTVDTYALGITMYTLLNRGAAPFMPAPPYIAKASDQKNASISRIHGDPLPTPVNCSERLMKIIRKACSQNPYERYSSASKMYDALEDFLDK